MAIFGAAENSRSQTNSYSGSHNKNRIHRPEKITRINDDFDYLEEEDLMPNPTSDQIYIKQQEDNLTQSQNKLTDNKAKRRKKNRPVDDFDEERANGDTQRQLRAIGQSINKSNLANAGNLLLKARARTVSVTVASWIAPLYIIQFFAAVLSLLAFGMGAAISSVIDGSFLLTAAEKVTGGLASLVGYDAVSLDIAGGTFMLMYGIALVFGFLSLGVALLICKLALFKPLSGKKAGLKNLLFVTALIGYSLPITNLFPWVTLLLLTIWKYPR